MENQRTKSCTKCGEILAIDNFYTNGKTPKGTIKYKGACKGCEKSKTKNRFITIIKDFYNKLECDICGYNNYFSVLELHHRDPKAKEASVGNMKNYSKERIEAELAKCDLLCANCHR